MMYKYAALFALAFFAQIAVMAPCPTACRCDSRRKIVFCNERNLNRVPFGIPSDTKTLFLQGNILTNDQTLEMVLRSLSQLERLDMHDNHLTSFPNNLPATLMYLSLRSNSIKYIGKNVLDNLTKLKKLYLDSNKITDLGVTTEVFNAASSLEELELSYNQLKKFPENLPKSLKSLRITHNNITVIKSVSLLLLRNLMVLDLSSNKIVDSTINFFPLQKLQTLNLNDNVLQNVPVYLPGNLTELRLDFNKIQFIFAKSGPRHGSFRGLTVLEKLDLSSNRLLSVENKAFDSLPPQASVELQDNPWRCDCNLLYLKKWLLVRGSILFSGKGEITCNTPDKFNKVTLEAIDVEVLTCPSDTIKVERAIPISPLSVEVDYDVVVDGEPPYVTYSLMYAEMLCDDCSLHGGISSSSHLVAHLWMKDYTIWPLETSSGTVAIGSLDPDTRYVVCVVASYQHPDQVGINQCLDVRTTAEATTSPIPVFTLKLSLPWIIVIVLASCIVIVSSAIVLFSCYNKGRRRNNRSYVPGRGLTSGMGLSLVDANREFDIKIGRPSNVSSRNERWQSDSREESVATTHTGTTNSRNSGREVGHFAEHLYETPIFHQGSPDNYDRIKLTDK